mmetsp:Transcript_12671/g.21315  ORF Transcript_12671/g.21315 Transcript_12671/m.21315 type:complete len:283 (-) Transcript_12671:476-1324(-)
MVKLRGGLGLLMDLRLMDQSSLLDPRRDGEAGHPHPKPGVVEPVLLREEAIRVGHPILGRRHVVEPPSMLIVVDDEESVIPPRRIPQSLIHILDQPLALFEAVVRVLIVGEAERVRVVPLGGVRGFTGVDEGVVLEVSPSNVGVEALHLHDLGLIRLDERLVQILHVDEPVGGAVLVVELPVHPVLLQQPEYGLLGSAVLTDALMGLTDATRRATVHEHAVGVGGSGMAGVVSIEKGELLGEGSDDGDVLGGPHRQLVLSPPRSSSPPCGIRESTHELSTGD